MTRLPRMSRRVWFGVGFVVGVVTAELLPWGAAHLIDLVQAIDFR